MQILLTESFQRDISSLSQEELSQLLKVVLKIPTALKTPHTHSGLGLRKLHSSGIYEARMGLGLRIVFGIQSKMLIFHRVGNHDEVQRYLKSL